MTKAVIGVGDFTRLVSDKKINAVLIGPGHGVNKRTENFVRAALKSGKNIVLDADALTVFQNKPGELFKLTNAAKGQVVLTPHVAGSSLNPMFRHYLWDIFLKNVELYQNGGRLLNELSPEQLQGL